MTCRDIEKQLPPYLEDLLSPEEKTNAEDHLAACPYCRQALSDLRRTAELLKRLEEMEPPPFFEQRIMSRIREAAGQRQGLLQRLFLPLRIKVPIQVLATFLIAVLGFYVFQKGEPEMKQVAPLSIPITESGKRHDAAESLSSRPHTGPAAVEPVPTPMKGPSGIGQRPFAVPPSGSGKEAERSAEVLAPTREDRSPAPAAPALQAERTHRPPAGAETADRMRGPAAKGKSDGASEASLPDGTRPERTLESGMAAAGTSAKKAAPTPPGKAAKADEAASDVTLTLHVGDMSMALQKVEERLNQANARIMAKDLREREAFLKAEVPMRSFASFLDRLEDIGRLSPERDSTALPNRPVVVHIRIVAGP